METVAFHTLGCKVNSYESQAMLEIFQKAGYKEVGFKEPADVYVINTCTVTNTGDSKSRQMIRKAIRQNKQAVVCVVGCYSQLASDVLQEMDGVSVILGTQYRGEIVQLVNTYKKENRQIVKVGKIQNVRQFEDLNIQLSKHTRAFVKIQDGCNEFCTYCIIPYARGRIRSRPPQSIIDQAKNLVASGYVEIVLTGIHTAGYGEDLDHYSFYDLLKDLIAIKGLQRIRISSIEITQISDAIIQLIGDNECIVDQIHVPLQSGCDSVLQRMNRKYTIAQFESTLHKIRTLLPEIAFTTDIITGFPGETEEEYNMTVETLRRLKFTELHVFPYSPRNNTPAARMKDQIDGITKQKRVNQLLQVSKELHEDFGRKQIGKTLSVLFETEEGDSIIGHASNYMRVKVAAKEGLIGTIQSVTIDSYQDASLLGRVI